MADDHVTKTVNVYNSIAAAYALQAELHAPITEREKFCQLIPAGGMILDAGCGSGRDCVYFAGKGYEVTGVDLSESLLEIARTKTTKARFFCQDLRYLSFADSLFDGIWSCASLLHLKREEIPSVLKKFFSILKPDGALFILVKSGVGEEETTEPSVPGKARFFTYFSRQELEKSIKDTGFSVLEMYTYNESERFPDGYNTEWLAVFARK
jgi:ubiquinone/menaquinone biosynthesis C-methylase UbiE